MKREGVIITTFTIERIRQIQLFQIKIPSETKNIIGIEMGVRILSGFTAIPPALPTWVLPINFKRNIVLGELKLQSYESANVFYTGELTLNNNTGNADFTSQFFIPQPFTHEYASNEDETTVSGKTTIVQGVYRDKLADQQEGTYSYKVNVYVWCEVKDEGELKI